MRDLGLLCGLCLVFGDDFWFAGDGRMHGVVREINEERLIFICFDELHRLVGFAVGEEFAGWSFGQRGNLVGGEEAGRLTAGVAADVHVETMLFRIVGFIAFFQSRR